jgi:hypothetical protein
MASPRALGPLDGAEVSSWSGLIVLPLYHRGRVIFRRVPVWSPNAWARILSKVISGEALPLPYDT